MDIKFYFPGNFNKSSMKYQSYPKSRKIDPFEQKICICYSLMSFPGELGVFLHPLPHFPLRFEIFNEFIYLYEKLIEKKFRHILFPSAGTTTI